MLLAALFLLSITAVGGGAPVVAARPHMVPSIVLVGVPAKSVAAVLGASDWPMYMQNVGRTSANPNETILSYTNTRGIIPLWTATLGGAVEGSAVAVNGVVYLGSGQGWFYALNATNGRTLWHAFLGTSTDPRCTSGGVYGNGSAGIASTATVAGGVVYVAGGDDFLYALNAASGAIEWRTQVGNTSNGYYNWGSPLLADGFLYYGTASRCDNPLVPAALLQINLTTHAVGRQFNMTNLSANGSRILGSSLWASPAWNPVTNTIFVTSGNPTALTAYYQQHDDSIVALNARTLTLVSSWRIPIANATPDGDFGASPTLFTGASGQPMVAAINKNGNLYAWNQSNLAAGPVWQVRLANASQNGYNIATASFSGGVLYIGGGPGTIARVPEKGTLAALNATTGSILWQISAPNPVYRAAAYASGLLASTSGRAFQVVLAATGKVALRSQCSGPLLSDPTIAEGRIFVGCAGTLIAYGQRLSAFGSATPSTGTAPLTVAFTSTPSGGVPPYKFAWVFGDGGTSNQPNPVHQYLVPSTYPVEMWVNDSLGNVSITNLTITVNAPGAIPHSSAPGFLGLPDHVGYVLVAVLLGAIAVVGFVLWRRRERRRAQPKFPPPRPYVATPVPPPGPPPGGGGAGPSS